MNEVGLTRSIVRDPAPGTHAARAAGSVIASHVSSRAAAISSVPSARIRPSSTYAHCNARHAPPMAGSRRGGDQRAADRASSASSRAPSKIPTTRSTVSPVACASHMNHGSRESGSGIAPRRIIAWATAS